MAEPAKGSVAAPVSVTTNTPSSTRRDLISSADTILDINRSCHHLVELVGEIQGGLGGLAGSIMERQHSVPDERANTSYDKLFGESEGREGG